MTSNRLKAKLWRVLPVCGLLVLGYVLGRNVIDASKAASGLTAVQAAATAWDSAESHASSHAGGIVAGESIYRHAGEAYTSSTRTGSGVELSPTTNAVAAAAGTASHPDHQARRDEAGHVHSIVRQSERSSNAAAPEAPCSTNTSRLAISGASIGNFAVTLNGSDQEVYTTLSSYSASNNTCSGWNIAFQATQFRSASGHLLPPNSLLMPPPTVSNCVSRCGAGPSAHPPTICIQSAEVPLDGGSAVVVASAALNTGDGTYSFTPGTIGTGGVELTVPSDAYATSYSSTLTVSLIQGPAASC